MSASGSSDRIRTLRETLAGLEQAGGGMAAAPVRTLAFGQESCTLDRLLGGLFSGALYEAAPARMGDLAAATGFALALAVRFAASHDGPILWMSDEFSLRENGAPYGPGVAAHGLDVRMPLFDRALAEWSFTLPTALKLHGACEKYVLKLALQKMLPEDIVWRRKFGMSVPITDWVLGPMRPLVDELLSDESVRNRGLLQPAYVAALRSGKDVASETRRRRLGERLWALVMLEGWCRRYIDGRSAV
jgi:hypothetical protein